MNILGLQETDWLTRGPHTQHHIFERLSMNPDIKVTVFEYDIDKIIRLNSLIKKKQNTLFKKNIFPNNYLFRSIKTY
ncbi:MAG: hypothetical protein ACTSO8_06080 [Promethearchaeota archaeon]